MKLLCCLLLALSSLSAAGARLVSLAPSFTTLIDELGACPQLVAQVGQVRDRSACPQAPEIARGLQWSDEELLALHPDLVLVWGDGMAPQRLQALQDLGLHLRIFDPHTLSDISAMIASLGRITGREEQAARLVAHYQRRAAELTRVYGASPWLNVFYQVWPQPLMTLAADHYVAQALRLCHLHLSSPLAHGAALSLSPEWLLTQPVQVILLPRHQALAPRLPARPVLMIDTSRLERPDAEMLDDLDVLCRRVRAAAR